MQYILKQYNLLPTFQNVLSTNSIKNHSIEIFKAINKSDNNIRWSEHARI